MSECCRGFGFRLGVGVGFADSTGVARSRPPPQHRYRRRSSFRELPARALAYFAGKFGSGSSAHEAKKGRAFSPHDDRTNLQSPRLATTTTSSLCSSPYSGDSYDGMQNMEPSGCELNGLSQMDVHMETDGFDLLSPKPAIPTDAEAGAVAREESGLQSPKIDIYSRPNIGDRHQAGMRPRAWSRDRSSSRGGGGCDSRHSSRRGCGGRGSTSRASEVVL